MEHDSRLANWFILYVAILLFFAVGAITTLGTGWYATLLTPSWTPPSFLVAVIWCVLFILGALSAQVFWDTALASNMRARAIWLYAGNVLLVLLWNYLFFGLHLLELAFAAACLVGLSLALLMVKAHSVSKRAALLLVPYAAWMIFALCLTYAIWGLNA